MELTFLKDKENKIPIPDPSYLKKSNNSATPVKETKYEREYDAFCRWSALPKDQRKPRKLKDFEKKWKIPQNYTEKFRLREDFEDRRLKYFWEWMMDRFPDVVQNIYKASDKNMKASQIFVDLIAKHIKIEKPPVNVPNMMLVGVPQEKIDSLFVPKGYENVEDITPNAD